MLIKLPPKMNRQAYEGFKIALGKNENAQTNQNCFACHRLPKMGDVKSKPQTPSLRNRSISIAQLTKLLGNETHDGIAVGEEHTKPLHLFLNTLSDVPDEEFRDLILKAKVLDTSGDK